MKPLTPLMRDYVSAALELETRGLGIFPNDFSQHSTVRALLVRGVLEFADYGYDDDGVLDHEVAIYRLTDAGRKLAQSWESPTAPQPPAPEARDGGA